MKTAIVAGHVCLDLTPRLLAEPRIEPGRLVEVGPLVLTPGGCVSNTGGMLAALGVPATLAAAVGHDDLGEILIALLDRMRLGTEGLVRCEGSRTSYSLVIETPARDRTFWHHVGANALFDGADVTFGDAAILHLGYPTHLPGLLADGARPWRALLERAKDAGLTTSVDLAEVDPDSEVARLPWEAILHGVLPLVDVISPSVDDLHSILGSRSASAGSWAELLVTWGAAAALVTDGSRGMSLRTGPAERLSRAGAALAPLAGEWSERRVEVAAHPAEVVTTTGAGDAASAGLVAAILRGEDPEAAARAAGTAAAMRMTAPASSWPNNASISRTMPT